MPPSDMPDPETYPGVIMVSLSPRARPVDRDWRCCTVTTNLNRRQMTIPLPGGAPGMISSATARASRTWVEGTAGRCELVRGRGPQDRVIAVNERIRPVNTELSPNGNH